MYQHERRMAALRADRELIERAAARLRSDAIRSGYAGLQHQHVAFGLALILDELARHLPDLDEAVRTEVEQSVRRVVQTLLHTPTVRVKELADPAGAVSYAAALAELFALDPEAVEAVTRAEGVQ